MSDAREQEAIDALIKRFFSAFDIRQGRAPAGEAMTGCFVGRAIIAKYSGGECEIHTPEEFAKPRVALLAGGDLVDFHEWEESADTQIAGPMAIRTSRYAKSGLYSGKAYAGRGTKFFQLGKSAAGWHILALSWIDDVEGT